MQDQETYLTLARKYYLRIQMLYGGDTMKKAMVYMIALTLAFSALLAGCGDMRGSDKETPTHTISPDVTAPVESMMPDPADGEVRDRDGIITDGDSGGNTATKPETKRDAAPGAGTGSTANGSAPSTIR